MAGEGDGKIFFLPKRKKPPDERKTADEKATSDSTVRQLPTRRRRTDDQGELAPHACDRGVRRPLATAENTTDAAAAAAAAAIKTMAANAPTDPRTLPGIQGLAPSFYPRLGLCRRRVNIGGRSGDEWGPRWKLAVGGVPWRRAAATANTAAAIKTMAANAPTNLQTHQDIQGLAHSFTASSVYPRLGCSGDDWGPRWELAVGGGSGKLWEAELA